MMVYYFSFQFDSYFSRTGSNYDNYYNGVCVCKRGSVTSKFSRNSEVSLLENVEEMFSQYYMQNYVCKQFKILLLYELIPRL